VESLSTKYFQDSYSCFTHTNTEANLYTCCAAKVDDADDPWIQQTSEAHAHMSSRDRDESHGSKRSHHHDYKENSSRRKKPKHHDISFEGSPIDGNTNT